MFSIDRFALTDIGEYGIIEETIAPEALEDIAGWIRETADSIFSAQ